MKLRHCCFALVLSSFSAAPVLTVASVAHAQDDVATQMARERFQEGVKFYDQKQYEKARAAFLQAYALKKHPAVLLNLAQSELRSGHEAEAATHFSEYIRDPNGSAVERQEAERGLAEAKKRVAEFSVTVEGAGAEVYVDGNLVGRAPLPGPIYLAPGNHAVEAKQGDKAAAANVNASAGQTGAIDLSFSNPGASGVVAPGGPPAGPGNPGPGGAPMGPAGPTAGPGPGAGPGGPGMGGAVGFDSGDERTPFIEWATENKIAWVGGGVTVLGLVGGIGFGLASNSSYDSADKIKNQILQKSNELNAPGPCGPPPKTVSGVSFAEACSKYQDRVDTAESQKTLSVVSFVVAGVAAGGTVVYYFVDSKKPKQTALTTTVVPIATPTEKGIGLVGTF